MEERLIFSGFGGQGLLTAGRLLAACAMAEGRHVTFFPSYGAEVRGGTAHCHVIIRDEPIASPLVEESTALLIMNALSMERFLPTLGPGGLMVLNASMAQAPVKSDGVELLTLHATELAADIGSRQVANMILLAALNEVKRLVKPERLLGTLAESLTGRKERFIPLNEKAIEVGRKHARDWLKKHKAPRRTAERERSS